jgi:hypothetical protein
MVLSVIAIGFAFLTANRKKRAGALDPEDYQQTLFVLIGNTVFLLIILLACAALILAKPAIVQQGGQYISWINPAIYAIAVVGLSMTIDVWWLSRMGRANESSCSRLELGVIVATLCVAAWVFMALRDTTFGYGGNTGLRAAATYLDAVADKRSAITFDTFEMFDYPYRFRVGFNCARGGQIVPYLNPAIRSRIPCQASDGQVGFGLSVDRVYVVREPLAWKGNRQIVLSGFPLRSKLLFNRTIVEEYVRESSP